MQRCAKPRARAPTIARCRRLTSLMNCAKPPKTASTTAYWSSSTKWASSSKPRPLEHGDDVYFFQQLAEAAARANGKLVVVGVLHQSFAQYGARLGTDTRDDWAKVQGRYVDLPFVAASDEVVELIGRAIVAERRPPWMNEASTAIANSITSRRPAVGGKFADCPWRPAGRCIRPWPHCLARYPSGSSARTNAAPLVSSHQSSRTASTPTFKRPQ